MAKMLTVLPIGVILTSLCVVQSARILGVFHLPSFSHFQIGNSILSELAARGHYVTFITPYKLNAPVNNLKEVQLTGFFDTFEEVSPKFFAEFDLSILTRIHKLDMMGYYFTEAVLSHPNVQKLLKSDEKFDLVIHDLFVNEALVGFAHHYQVPSIAVSCLGFTQWASSRMANPHNPAYIPDFNLSYPKDMNLFQRVLNTLLHLGSELHYNLYSLQNHNKLLQKYFPGSPHLYDLHHNASLILLNSHVSTQNPVPLLPNMIEIGGCHIKPPTPLPKDLQDYLDGAKQGAIFFSLGSVLKSKDMPVKKREVILRALGKLQQKVLWKWEGDSLPELPSNVKLVKCAPQQSVLAHPNVKLFISHGGLLSTIEAVYYGKPVLGLSTFYDQVLNLANGEKAGFAIRLVFKNINEDNLRAAMDEMLSNPRYTENAKRRSKLFHDQPQKPLDTALYWIEYVLRHQGAPHLKTAALNLRWYQYLLLDVVGVTLLSLALASYIFWKSVKFICTGKNKYLKVKQNHN